MRVDQAATYLVKFKMSPAESSGELGFKLKVKRKKAHEISLSSLRKDREAFDMFNNNNSFVVGPFHVKVPIKEQDFKLAQYLFTESLPDG